MRNKIKEGNYYVVQWFMIRDLKLKGLELACYAIIYGFSQTDGQSFTGSLQYLCEWTGSSRQAVINALNNLVEKEFLVRNDKYVNGVKFVEYQSRKLTTSQESLRGVKKLDRGSQETLHNNILDNKGDIKDIIDIREPAFDGTSSGNLSLSCFTEQLTEYGYIQKNDIFIDKYNELFEKLVNEYGFDLVRSCVWYFIKKMKEGKFTDIKGHQINNKFEYLKISLEKGINKLTNEEMTQPYKMFFENEKEQENAKNN